MTTLDGLLDTDRLAAIEARAAERKPIDWRRVWLAVFLAVPLLLGVAVAHLRIGAALWRAAFLTSMDERMTRATAITAQRRE